GFVQSAILRQADGEIGLDEAHLLPDTERAVGIEAKAGVKVIDIRELTLVVPKRLLFQLDNGVDFDKAIGHECRPNLVGEALELPIRAATGLEQHGASRPVVGVLLEKAR